MIAAIIQARLSSSRLPHKVLMEVTPGISMLEMVIRKVRLATRVDDIWVTSPDWAVCKVAKHCGAQANWWNKPRDVLGEYYTTAMKAMAQSEGQVVDIVRVTGDCPLLDPEEIDRILNILLDEGYDIVSNTDERAGKLKAEGSDAEAFSMAALERAYREATLPEDREHVTLYMRRTMRTLCSEPEESFGLTSVDTYEDYKRICQKFK